MDTSVVKKYVINILDLPQSEVCGAIDLEVFQGDLVTFRASGQRERQLVHKEGFHGRQLDLRNTCGDTWPHAKNAHVRRG